MGKRSTRIITVTGDITVDWNIARIRRADADTHIWNADDVTCAFPQRGGSAMLADLIEAVAEQMKQYGQADLEVHKNDALALPIKSDDARYHHSYAIWAPFKRDEAERKGKRVWRVQEFLGLYQAGLSSPPPKRRQESVDGSTDPLLVVLDDAAMGFRDNQAEWPEAVLNPKSKSWFLLKMARPVAKGNLWNHLLANHSDRLVVVMALDDLRRTEVQISRQVSWERTAQDLIWELLHNKEINGLSWCRHVIVSCTGVGTVLLTRGKDVETQATLFFDQDLMEGEWGRAHRGYMIGYTSCLTAGIARELMLQPAKPDLNRGIQSGIHAMRFLHREGYGEADKGPERISLAFPASNIADKLAEDTSPLAVAPIKSTAQAMFAESASTIARETHRFWTILEDQNPDSLEQVAQEIVRTGVEHALSGVPRGRFGKLTTVDRQEIESLRSISGLMREYCQRPHNKPLSICVFGPPGSGKSFAVKQVAETLGLGGKDNEALTFNLSQIEGPEGLLDALHQVRDRVLSGYIPLVFWDEFDTALQGQLLGWLRYFLAPMQDGEFQEGQVIHPIGQSIFVFAGGTCHNIEAFGTNLDEEQRRFVKLPDFVSRLKGYLNILGPNELKSHGHPEINKDPYYIIRRAILFRSLLSRNAGQLIHRRGKQEIISIDRGILRAFLLIGAYKHGTRSMEAIVSMSQLAGKTSFERSSLPTEAQLNLHVNGREFFALIHMPEFDGPLLETLAKAAHDVYCEGLRAEGYVYGKRSQKGKKVHSALVPYDQLPEHEKEQNRDNVRDIRNKLAIVGYTMVPARGGEPAAEFTADEVEKLAEREHERWVNLKIKAGWQYGKPTNKAKRLHQCLLPWNDLPDDEQDKDRALVKGIPRILAKAGYTMVSLY